MEPTIEEILKAIKDSGYLFEQEIASKIEQKGYHIQTNSAYNDIDEEKSREMDVIAYKSFYFDEKQKISIGIRILCECKNNKNPFVFITRNKGLIDELYCPPNFLFPKSYFQEIITENPKTYREIKAFKYYKIDSIFPYSQANTKAVQFSKLIQKNKEWHTFHDGIYDSLLLPLSKCLEYFKKKDSSINTQEWKNFILYFPVIVLNSKIFYIDSHEDSSIVKETDFISFTRSIESKKQSEVYLFDFVNSQGLEKYINEHIELFASEFVRKVTSQPSHN